MTVRDLVECAPFLKNIEVVVRENGGGWWIQGFRIGPDAKIYKYEYCVENRERVYSSTKLKEEESIDIERHHGSDHPCPVKAICVSPERAPADVLDLVVYSYQPRHIPQYHGDAATHNDFDLEIDCYPPEHQEKLAAYRETKEAKTDDQLEGQMSIEEFLGE